MISAALRVSGWEKRTTTTIIWSLTARATGRFTLAERSWMKGIFAMSRNGRPFMPTATGMIPAAGLPWKRGSFTAQHMVTLTRARGWSIYGIKMEDSLRKMMSRFPMWRTDRVEVEIRTHIWIPTGAGTQTFVSGMSLNLRVSGITTATSRRRCMS